MYNSFAPKLLISTLILSFSSAVLAESPVETKKKLTQKQRIEKGIASGNLTTAEQAKLMAEREAIAKTKAAYKKSGGTISDSEKAILNDMKEQASKQIYKQKHDDQVVEGSDAAIKKASEPAKPVDPNKKPAVKKDLSAELVKRSENQAKRIEKAVASGLVTQGEQKKLQAEQDAIKATEEAYKKSGGTISRNENKILEDMRDKASQHINAERKDKVKREPIKELTQEEVDKLIEQQNKYALGSVGAPFICRDANYKGEPGPDTPAPSSGTGLIGSTEEELTKPDSEKGLAGPLGGSVDGQRRPASSEVSK